MAQILLAAGESFEIVQHNREFGGRQKTLFRVDGTGAAHAGEVRLDKAPAPVVVSSSGIQLDDAQPRYVVGPNEQLIVDFMVDFDQLPSQLRCSFSARTQQSNSGSGVYYVRIGGSWDTPDGAIVAILSSGLVSYGGLQTVMGAPFNNPGGKRLVKITGNGSGPTTAAYIRNILIHLAEEKG